MRFVILKYELDLKFKSLTRANYIELQRDKYQIMEGDLKEIIIYSYELDFPKRFGNINYIISTNKDTAILCYKRKIHNKITLKKSQFEAGRRELEFLEKLYDENIDF